MMKKFILFLCQGLEEYESNVFKDTFCWTITYGLEPIQLVTVGLRHKIKCFGVSLSNQNINYMKSGRNEPHIQSWKEKSEAIKNMDFKAHRWVVARKHSWMNPLPPGSDTLGKEGRK